VRAADQTLSWRPSHCCIVGGSTPGATRPRRPMDESRNREHGSRPRDAPKNHSRIEGSSEGQATDRRTGYGVRQESGRAKQVPSQSPRSEREISARSFREDPGVAVAARRQVTEIGPPIRPRLVASRRQRVFRSISRVVWRAAGSSTSQWSDYPRAETIRSSARRTKLGHGTGSRQSSKSFVTARQNRALF
jgi:hypothetical protein